MRKLPLALGIAGLWALVAASGAIEPLERLTVQARYALRPSPGFKAPVTVVAIDERSLSTYGQFPWDRQVFAKLLDRLKAEGAAVVGVDVAFNEPARAPEEDAALTRAIAGVPTVLPTFLAYADAGRQTLTPIEPLPEFARAAVALGSIQLSTHQQAQIWELEPYQATLGRWVPAFPVAVAGAFQGQAWTPVRPGFPWRDRPSLIDFRGPAHSAPQLSAVDVLSGALPPGSLKGRIALVGAVAVGLPDTNFAIPDYRQGPMAGVELSAHVIDNLLESGFQRRLSPWALALLLALLAMGPGRALAGVTPRRAWWALGLGAGWSAAAFAAFWAGVWLDLLPILGATVSWYAAGLFAERTHLLESRNQLLARYASDLAGEAQRQRARIEGELHDGIQQLLIVMSREVRQVQKLGPTEAAAARVGFLAELTEQAQAEIKRLRSDLLPPALRHGGLLEALPALASEKAARSGLDVQLAVSAWEPLARERDMELYWLIAEALTNAEKHASATHVTIRLACQHGVAIIEVEDDGRGFTPPDLSVAPAGIDHSGLHRMWLRMRGNHGDLSIRSAPGAGTCLSFKLPVEAGRVIG